MKVGIVIKESDPEVKKIGHEFANWLKSKKIKTIARKKKDVDNPPVPTLAPDDLDLVFVLGGDGTFLSAARWVGTKKIPLLGIKFGEVGFLAETEGSRLYEAAKQILTKEYNIEQRLRFKVELERNKEIIFSQRALNEAVIGKSGPAGLARIEVEINKYPLTTYAGDGLIISTPTGSTAYSLASGGPVVHPSLEVMLLVPICPFTLTNRPLIIGDTSCLELRLAEKSAAPLKLGIDGQKETEFLPGDKITLKKSDPVHLITLPDQTYYDVLKTKLKWSGERI